MGNRAEGLVAVEVGALPHQNEVLRRRELQQQWYMFIMMFYS